MHSPFCPFLHGSFWRFVNRCQLQQKQIFTSPTNHKTVIRCFVRQSMTEERSGDVISANSSRRDSKTIYRLLFQHTQISTKLLPFKLIIDMLMWLISHQIKKYYTLNEDTELPFFFFWTFSIVRYSRE
jgi:hypothetical protein